MNKKNYSQYLILGLLLLLSLHVTADLVVFPSGDASWTVDVVSNNSSSGTPVLIKKEEVTQLGDVKRIVLNWSDGKTAERWTLPKLPVVFEEDPRDGSVSPTQNNSLKSTLTDFFLTYDSFAFAWVTPENLQEKNPISYQGKQCFHYLGSVTPPYQRTVYKREAWIDAKTLLPVALDNGISLSTFTFSPKPPTDPLVMPPAFEKAINYYKIALGYP